MMKAHGRFIFDTKLIQNDQEGWIGIELLECSSGADCSVASIIYWDAEGQFSLQISAEDLPLKVVEDFIAEAKSKIKV